MKTYHYIVGITFAAVAVVHLIRIINHWSVNIGPWDVPLSVSWVGFVAAGGVVLFHVFTDSGNRLPIRTHFRDRAF